MTSAISLPHLTVIKLEWHAEGILVMTFNRPQHMNSLSRASCTEWKQVMELVHQTPSIHVLVITGSGRAYSAGQELPTPKQNASGEEENERLRANIELSRQLTKLLITSPVPIIAAVNGPAIGYGCTSLALCDLVISVEQAVFRTPFAELALCAEGCSSVTFPRILGPMVANAMLLFCRTMSAKEMHQRGFVDRLVKSEDLMPVTMGVAKELASRSQAAISASRSLLRHQELVDELVRVNDREMDEIYKRATSADSKQAIAAILKRMQSKGARPKM